MRFQCPRAPTRRVLSLVVACAAMALAGAAAAADLAEAGKAWWGHIAFLASDQMQGRLTGTPAYDRAADYVAAQFKALGLKPAGAHGWFQPVRLVEQRVIADRSMAPQ